MSMVVNAIEENYQNKRVIRNSGMRVTVLNRVVVSIGLTKVTFEQRIGGSKGARESCIGEEHFRQRE